MSHLMSSITAEYHPELEVPEFMAEITRWRVP
jgi:hypothetical protein